MKNKKGVSSIVCSKCNTQNHSENKFCYNCGNSLFNTKNVDSVNQNEFNNKSNVYQIEKEKKSKKSDILTFIGIFVSFFIFVFVLQVIGLVLFIIISILAYIHNGDDNPYVNFFNFMGSAALCLILFGLLLFGMCAAMFSF